MPVVFDCEHCGQLLSISLRKAGELVTCPQCLQRTQVPLETDPSPSDESSSKNVLSDEPKHGLQMGPERDWLVSSSRTTARRETGKSRQADAGKPSLSLSANPGEADSEEEEEGFQLRKRAVPLPGLDMTPMVDVVMLLLIFFMITASFVTQKSLETTPPDMEGEGIGRTESVADVIEDSILVRIDEKNEMTVDDKPVYSASELKEVLLAKISSEKKREMVIEVHPAALHGTVVMVTDVGLDVDMQRIRRTTSGVLK
jgi:biopolymer transport protein ExbD